jgi:hypothetical protein
MPSVPIFTPEQEKVRALLSAGHTATAAGAAVGVHRNTVGNWLRSSDFRPTLAHIQRSWPIPRTPAGVRLKGANAIVAAARAPFPAHPDDVQTTGSVHQDAQPVSVLPGLSPAPEPKPEPAPVRNSRPQNVCRESFLS